MKRLICAFFVVPILACAAQAAAQMAVADLYNPSGEHVGVAILVEGDDGVRVTVNLRAMPPGTHAIHIHAAGSCETVTTGGSLPTLRTSDAPRLNGPPWVAST